VGCRVSAVCLAAMDVDTDNFEDALALFEQHLPRAAFVALDLEMTGISGPPDTRSSQGDVPQVQYEKARAVVTRPYNIVQVGICLFEEPRPRQFVCRPFNVYVFPRPFSEFAGGKSIQVEDNYMGLSASSMIFLAGNGLDFNRWVGKGVSYVDAAQEQDLLRGINTSGGETGAGEGGASSARGIPETTKPQDATFIEETLRKVEAFAASGGAEMRLPSANKFLALILRLRIGEKFPKLVVEKRPGASNPHWEERWVVNLSDDQRRQRDETAKQRILSHIGFRRMWNSLRSHRRPVVFHNGFFDLLFMCEAFEGALPHSLDAFKKIVIGQFPNLFDTKVLAESAELSGLLGKGVRSSLPELSSALASRLRHQPAPPLIPAEPAEPAEGVVVVADSGVAEEARTEVSFTLPEGFDSYTAADGAAAAFHTAGYDAYQTGRVFAFFRSRLGDMKTLEFNCRVFLMASAFELSLSEATDRIMFDGVARQLYDIDTAAVTTKGLSELLKPVLEDGKRKYAIRQCGGGRSMLLIVHGSADVAKEAPERAAVEQCLDGLLQPQQEQGRLRFRSLDEYLAELAETAAEHDKTAPTRGGEKRRRTS